MAGPIKRRISSIMTSESKLACPPIIEVLIGIDIHPRDDLDADDLEKLSKTVEAGYPKKENFVTNELFFQLNPDGADLSKHHKNNGFLLKTEDEKQIVRITPENFSFSRLAPYVDGVHLISEFKTIWGAYCEMVKPVNIMRLGLRYINKFNLPLDEIDDNLKIRPIIGSGKNPLFLGGAMARYLITSPTFGSNAIVNVILDVNPEDSTQISITLDIDVFQENIEYYSLEALEAILNNLRMFKNEIFFANIPNAKELFK